jgi:ABC-type multidrug transport system fused ATPase/permease subunit
MYLRAAGTETWVGMFCILLAARAMRILQTWFLKHWAESYEDKTSSFLPPASENVNAWLGVYVCLTLMTAALWLSRFGLSYHGSFKASRALLYACLLRVTNAPSRWLDENPTGRLLNRFTADIGSIDNTMQQTITNFCDDIFGTIVCVSVMHCILKLTLPVYHRSVSEPFLSLSLAFFPSPFLL